MESLRLGSNLLSLSEPLVMGVLNITPDSFYAESRVASIDAFLTRVSEMLHEGADIIDIGAFSSRPGAQLISEDEELKRLKPFLNALKDAFPRIPLSIDTYRSAVVRSLSDFMSFMVNDITGFDQDPDILDVVQSNDLPYILMHMKGIPENMQSNADYTNVCDELLEYFSKKIHVLHAKGIHQFMIDPGFGFGKTVEHNYELLSGLSVFNIFEKPVLVGLSRKSMIYKLLDIQPEGALNGTTALHMVALQNGAKILRAHDVKEAKQTIRLWKALETAVNK